MAARRSPAGAVIAALAVWVGAVGIAAAQPVPTPRKAADDKAKVVERPVVGVIDLTDGMDSLALVQAITRAIAEKPEVATVTDQRVGAALVERQVDEDQNAIETARDELNQANDNMAALDNVAAYRDAAEGRKALKNVAPTPEVTELIADLAFAEGQAHFARRDQNKSELVSARAAFTLVHRFSPGRTLDPNLYLTELIDEFAKAGKPQPGFGTLDVSAEGTIWIDGKEQTGESHSYQVPPGTHWIAVTGPDREPWGEWRDLADGQRLPVSLPRHSATGAVLAARARRNLRVAPDVTASASAMATIARIAGLTAAVIVRTDQDGALAVQLWRNKEPGFGKIEKAKQPWSSEAERVIAPLLPPKPIDDNTDIFHPPPVPHETPKPWYRKRWVQVSIVAGVIGVIASSIAISNASGAPERPWGFGSVEPMGHE